MSSMPGHYTGKNCQFRLNIPPRGNGGLDMRGSKVLPLSGDAGTPQIGPVINELTTCQTKSLSLCDRQKSSLNGQLGLLYFIN